MTFGDSITDIELNHNKWVVHQPRLKTLAEGGDIYPVTVELDLVDYCNHSCWWCVDPRHGKNKLKRRFVSRVLKELKSLGDEGIVYKGGGEPALHPDFSDILGETKDLGFEVGIVTNGSRLNNVYDSVVENASYIRVSIDCPTPESHRNSHGGEDFHEIIGGVQKTVERRKEKGQRHPVIGLSFAMDYSMKDMIGEAIKLGDKLCVDYILLRPPFFEEVGRKSTMTVEQGNKLRAAFENGKKSYDGPTRILIDYWISDIEAQEIDSKKDSPRRGSYMRKGANGIEHVTGRCFASPLMAIITAERKVYPCCNLRFLDGWEVGTIDYDTGMTFEKIWNSKRREEVMERIHGIECIRHCTHPMSKYNEVIEYMKSPQYHRGFV